MGTFKVLLIDDSATIRKTAQAWLKGKCDLVVVENGLEALPAVLKFGPELIFVDVQMPSLDGFNFCQLVKQHEDYRMVPVVFLTSQNSPLDRAKGKMAGADAYLTKPFTKDDLEQMVDRYRLQLEVRQAEKVNTGS